MAKRPASCQRIQTAIASSYWLSATTSEHCYRRLWDVAA